jgi:hypothetical protein
LCHHISNEIKINKIKNYNKVHFKKKVNLVVEEIINYFIKFANLIKFFINNMLEISNDK